jgi:hypothetical protein
MEKFNEAAVAKFEAKETFVCRNSRIIENLNEDSII